MRFSAAYLQSKPVKSEPSLTGVPVVYPDTSPDTPLIDLGTSENRLMSDFLLPKLRELATITETTLTYSGLRPSTTTLLPNLCSFYRDYLGIADAKPRSFVLCHGVSGVLRNLGSVFLDPGDVVLLPAPISPEIFRALERFRPQFHPFDPSNLPLTSPHAKLLILHNLATPLGDPAVLSWGLQLPGCQILVDDSYALCDRHEGTPFASLFATADPTRVHHCYGLAGDWGMAGIPFAVFSSRSKAVLRAMDFANGTFDVSGPVLRAAEALFSDRAFVADYARALKTRLAESEAAAAALLTDGGLAVLRSPGGTFLTLDLSGRIRGEEEEHAALLRLRAAGVGVRIHAAGRSGLVGVSYAVPRGELEEGCRRIVACMR
jgi:aspartate/methionine/tyrosine aminotransferase